MPNGYHLHSTDREGVTQLQGTFEWKLIVDTSSYSFPFPPVTVWLPQLLFFTTISSYTIGKLENDITINWSCVSSYVKKFLSSQGESAGVYTFKYCRKKKALNQLLHRQETYRKLKPTPRALHGSLSVASCTFSSVNLKFSLSAQNFTSMFSAAASFVSMLMSFYIFNIPWSNLQPCLAACFCYSSLC